MRFLSALAVAVLIPATAASQASTVVSGGFANPIPVASYSMFNGATGYWQYHDYIYPDSDNDTDYGWLSGGTGLLTDGVSATQSWDQGSALTPYGGDHGVFVGWYFNHSITFYFSSAIQLGHMRVNYDISNFGDVGPPGPVTVNGVEYETTIPTGTAPFWADYDLSLTPYGASQSVSFTRTDGIPWLMISEVEFSMTSTPEPATVVLLASGLLGVFGVARRRARSRN